MVAEDGPEAIIPLSQGKNARGVSLWRQAGEMLNVFHYRTNNNTASPSYSNSENRSSYAGDVYAGNRLSIGGASSLTVQDLSSYSGAAYSRNGVWNNAASETYGGASSTVNNSNPRMTIIGVHPHALGGIITTPHMGMVAEDGPEAVIPLSPNQAGAGVNIWRQAGEMLGVSSAEMSIGGGMSYPVTHTGAEFSLNDYDRPQTGPDAAIALSASMDTDSLSRTFGGQDSTLFSFPSVVEDSGEAPQNPAWTAVYSLLQSGDGGEGGNTDNGGLFQNVTTDTVPDADGDSNVTFEIHVDQHNEYNVDGKDLDEAKVVAIINAHSLDNANELAEMMTKKVVRAFANIPLKGRA